MCRGPVKRSQTCQKRQLRTLLQRLVMFCDNLQLACKGACQKVWVGLSGPTQSMVSGPRESKHVLEPDGRVVRKPRSKLLRSHLCGDRRAGQLARQAETLRLHSTDPTLPRSGEALLQTEPPPAQCCCVGEGSALIGDAVVCG